MATSDGSERSEKWTDETLSFQKRRELLSDELRAFARPTGKGVGLHGQASRHAQETPEAPERKREERPRLNRAGNLGDSVV